MAERVDLKNLLGVDSVNMSQDVGGKVTLTIICGPPHPGGALVKLTDLAGIILKEDHPGHSAQVVMADLTTNELGQPILELDWEE
jgi:hypothetical protein